ncbi:MAG: DUF6493 family protein [Janthinobacterium lividum]
MLPPAETFEHIIRQQTAQQLVPFLLGLGKQDIVPVRQKTLRLKKELEEYKQVEVKPGKLEWTCLLTPQQDKMLFLTGLATYSRKEALGRGFTIPTFFIRESKLQLLHNQQLLLAVLQHAQPAWLAEWLARTARTNPWQAPSYGLLRALETEGLLAYDQQLVAPATAEWLNLYNWWRNFQRPAIPEKLPPAQIVLPDLQADAVLLQRDLPLLFDFDTGVDSALVFDNERREATTWLTLLPQLVASGHLDRDDLLTRSLLALRRDFRRPLLTWFKNLYGSLRPTPAESLARQVELVELLAHPLPLVVNFALDQLKEIWLEAAFEAEALLRYAEGLLTRPDLKTGSKTLLAGMGRLLKVQPAHAQAVSLLYAAALGQADAAVQERAAKGLAELLGAKKPLLAPAEAAEVTAILAGYTDLLAPASRTVLARWLTEMPTAELATKMEAVSYVPQSTFVPDLSAATALVPVADWHELLFLTGQVLKHDDPLALERWLDGLLRLHADLPTDYPAQLLPYLVQARPFLQGKTEQEAAAILAGNGLVGYLGLVQALLLSWAQGFTAERVKQVTLSERYATSDPLVAVEQRRLVFAESLLRERWALPLLSTPTHAPHWVAPTALLARLLAYEAAGQAPDPADLAVALARTAHAHPAEAAQALAQLPQLRHDGLRELLHWLLGPAEALPQAVTSRESWFGKLKEVVGQLLPTATAPVTLAEALPHLWAVAARTKRPVTTYPALGGLALNDYPNVGRPWQPHWELQPKSNTYVEQWKPGKPERTDRWTELHVWTGPKGGASPGSLLLYALHAAYRPPHDKYHIWYQITPLATDYPFLVALLPQYPAPLYWHTIRLAATRDAADAGYRDVLTQAMHSLLLPGATFEEATSLLLAIGLTHHVSTVRALALEALLAAIATGRLIPAALGQALGKLLSADFVPLPRFIEQLAQARVIDAITDDALRQVLDALLPTLPAEPLRQTSKLLSFYVDLHTRYPQPIPSASQARLREWASATALKKLVKALI